jgi:hypothetical protein
MPVPAICGVTLLLPGPVMKLSQYCPSRPLLHTHSLRTHTPAPEHISLLVSMHLYMSLTGTPLHVKFFSWARKRRMILASSVASANFCLCHVCERCANTQYDTKKPHLRAIFCASGLVCDQERKPASARACTQSPPVLYWR